MADLPSGDPPVESTNGGSEGQQESIAPESGRLARDQILADSDQTLADADQTASDSDQTAADSDQAAADSDQAASDRDLLHGGDPAVHEQTRDLRDRSAHQRQESAEMRVAAAAARDAVARARDLAAAARDQVSALHDRELAARDSIRADEGRSMTAVEVLLHAASNRKRAASDRAAAADGRARAAADREQAAGDRQQAARDRSDAESDREELLEQLKIAETDSLTGTRTRAAGLADLEHEIDRARRTAGLLVLAFIDVVGLKAANDEHGHAFGDALLRRAVEAIRAHVRSYDLIVRLGGDEFLCVMSGATIQEARQRFRAVRTTLARDAEDCEIKVGLAALAPDDSAAELIERADAELPTRSGAR